MTEMDFDELDKAVMSLMKDVKPDAKSPAVEDEPVEKVLSISPEKTPAVVSEPAAEPVPSPEVSEPKADPTTNVPIFRRTGRIMDVAKGTSLTPVTKPVSRQASVIAPPSSTISDFVSSATPAQAPARPVVKEEAVEEPTAPASDSHSMPDPIDFTAMKATKEAAAETVENVEPPVALLEPETAPDPVPVTEPEPVEAPKEAVKTPEPAPDYTPFIADAKVEKRPLGTPISVAVEPSPAPTQALAAEEPKTPDTPPAEPAAAPADLPDELDTNLVAIESGTASSSDQEPDDVAEAPKKELAAERPTGSGDRFGGQAQIPQQYQEAVSSGEQEHVPIYDTAALHQPLTHPAKKPASWLWIIWILGIMLLGAGVAAALYYFHVL